MLGGRRTQFRPGAILLARQCYSACHPYAIRIAQACADLPTHSGSARRRGLTRGTGPAGIRIPVTEISAGAVVLKFLLFAAANSFGNVRSEDRTGIITLRCPVDCEVRVEGKRKHLRTFERGTPVVAASIVAACGRVDP